jgi:hypothetical protein
MTAKAICDTATGAVLLGYFVNPPAQPAGRIAIPLDALVEPYAKAGYPLVWDGANTVTVNLAFLKPMRLAEVKVLRDQAEAAGVTVSGQGRFDSDPDSQRKILSAAVAASAVGSGFSQGWRLQNNSVVTLGASQMSAVGLAVNTHVNACQARKNTLDAAINAASSLAALDAIDITTGWPT